MSDDVADKAALESTHDQDFRQLSREREIGEPLTAEDREAAQRVVNAYWPRFHAPRPLPKRWR